MIKRTKSNIYRREHVANNNKKIFMFLFFHFTSSQPKATPEHGPLITGRHCRRSPGWAPKNPLPMTLMFSFRSMLFVVNHRRSRTLPNRRYGSIKLHLGSLKAGRTLTMVHKWRACRVHANTPVRIDSHGSRR